MQGATMQRLRRTGRQAMQGDVDAVRGQIEDVTGFSMKRRAGQTVFDNIGANVRGLGFAIMVIVMVGFMIYYVGQLDAAENATIVNDLISSGGDALTLIAGLFALLGLALIMRYVFAFLNGLGGDGSGANT